MESTTKREMLTVAEVASILGIGASTVYRALRAGEMPSSRVRGRWLIPQQGIVALLQPQAAPTPTRVQGELDE